MNRRHLVFAAATLFGAAVGAILATSRRSTSSLLPQVPWLATDDALKQHWPLFLCALGCWAAFSLYWEAAAKNAAPAQRSESKSSRSVHVFLVNVAVILVFAPIRGLGRFVPASTPIMCAGLAIEAIGLFIAIWARRHLGRHWSGAISIKVEHQLVRSGPYRWLRHPIYTGLLAMYIGPALVTGEILALSGVAMTIFAYWRKIRLEEAALDTAFGDDYDAYRRETWSLVPGVF